MMKKLKIIFIVVITVFIITVVYFYFSVNKLVIKDANMYSIVGGSVDKYTGTLTLKQNKDGSSDLSGDGTSITLTSTPIYYKNQKKILLPQSMEIVTYKEPNKMFKLNYFATIEQKDNKLMVHDKNYEAAKSDFFLFDGNDTYIFLNKTKIVYGKSNIMLPPFSYITNIYNNKLTVYDYESGSYHEYPVKGEKVTAELGDGNEIDLNTDTLKTNGQQLLLIKQIADLKNIE